MPLKDKTQIIKYITIILVLLAIFSCKKQENSGQSNTENINLTQDANQAVRLYIFENDEYVQRAKIQEIDEKTISFVLISENKFKKVSNTISGVAKLKKGVGGTEIDEDKKGNAYFVDEYIYTTDLCWLAFRIDIDTKSLMKIKEADCDTLRNHDCPFESIGILKLREKQGVK